MKSLHSDERVWLNLQCWSVCTHTAVVSPRKNTYLHLPATNNWTFLTFIIYRLYILEGKLGSASNLSTFICIQFRITNDTWIANFTVQKNLNLNFSWILDWWKICFLSSWSILPSAAAVLCICSACAGHDQPSPATATSPTSSATTSTVTRPTKEGTQAGNVPTIGQHASCPRSKRSEWTESIYLASPELSLTLNTTMVFNATFGSWR